MARAYGSRPSALLGVPDPLRAYQFDVAVFALDEAIDGAISRERRRIDLAGLKADARRKVRRDERRIARVIDRILGHHDDLPAAPTRPVEFVWNEDRTEMIAFRYQDQVAA